MGEAVASHLRSTAEVVLPQLDETKDSLPADLRVNLDEAREQQQLTTIVQPDVAALRVEDWLDQSLLDQLQQEGFFDRLARQ